MRHRTTQTGKMLVPLLSVLAILAIGVAVAAIVFLNTEHERRIAKEQELRLAQNENDELKTHLEESQQAKAKMDEELGRLRKDITEAKAKLTQAQSEQQTLAQSMQDREKEIARLTKDLEQSRVQHKDIVAQLSDLQQERESLKTQLAQLEQTKGALESKVTALSDPSAVQLGTVVVGEPAQASNAIPAGPKNGQVMVVNQEYDFVVINLGKSQGLSVGQEFQVVRGAEVLGTVKVEKVYDELSAAAILPDSKKESIREGDMVKAL